jgi:ribokinase
MQSNGVVVFGSINIDLVAQTPRLPQPGETLIGSNFYTTPGGKGANQAVAAARLGAPTWMVGRVGKDGFGPTLVASLQQAQVNTEAVRVDESTHSGVAMILVGHQGENQIVGVFGANGQMGAADVERLQRLIETVQPQVLLLQLEVPIAAVQAAAQVAHAAGITVILDPAPVPQEIIAPLYQWVDILAPNEVEASQLVGFAVHSPETAQRAAHLLQQQGAKTVIVKLGAQGALCVTPETQHWVPAFAVQAIDTVAAGDAFAGGLAAALAEGRSLSEALRWGCAAGALATTQVGAQTAMGDRVELLALLESG